MLRALKVVRDDAVGAIGFRVNGLDVAWLLCSMIGAAVETELLPAFVLLARSQTLGCPYIIAHSTVLAHVEAIAHQSKMVIVAFAADEGATTRAALDFEAASARVLRTESATRPAFAYAFAGMVDFVGKGEFALGAVVAFAKESVHTPHTIKVCSPVYLTAVMHNADVMLAWWPFVAGLVPTKLVKDNDAVLARVESVVRVLE